MNWVDPSGLKPGDQFPSMGEAAGDVLNYINPTSISQNREYGGYIVKNPNGSYSATNPLRGGPAGVNVGPVPTGGSASYHTHGGYDPRYDNENFSPVDIWGDAMSGIPGFLGTPGGAFIMNNAGRVKKRFNMSIIRFFLILAFSIGTAVASAGSALPEKGVLTTEKSAIQVAETILVNVYGETVLEQRPFKAKLEGDVWEITGTFHCPQGVGCKGGVARIEINKKDGKVKSVIHDK